MARCPTILLWYDQQSLVSSLEPCAFNGARRAPGDWKPGQVCPTPLSQHQYAILNHCEANHNCMNSHVKCIYCIEIPILRTWSVNRGLSHQHSQGGHRWVPNCKFYTASMLNSGKLHVFSVQATFALLDRWFWSPWPSSSSSFSASSSSFFNRYVLLALGVAQPHMKQNKQNIGIYKEKHIKHVSSTAHSANLRTSSPWIRPSLRL